MMWEIALEFTKDITILSHVCKWRTVWVRASLSNERIDHPSFHLVFTGCGDALVRCFDARSGVVKRTFKSHTLAVNCIQVDSTFCTVHWWEPIDFLFRLSKIVCSVVPSMGQWKCGTSVSWKAISPTIWNPPIADWNRQVKIEEVPTTDLMLILVLTSVTFAIDVHKTWSRDEPPASCYSFNEKIIKILLVFLPIQ